MNRPSAIRVLHQTFDPPEGLPWAAHREAPEEATGDLNQDGKLDIVFTGPGAGSGTVQILPGNGDSTFRVGARYASLTLAQQVTISDIDGDGNLDIFVGSGGQGLYAQDSNDQLTPMLQFLLGRGDGTFVGAPVYTQSQIAQTAMPFASATPGGLVDF